MPKGPNSRDAELDSYYEVDLDDVIILVEAQAWCIEDDNLCDPIPMIDIVRTEKENRS